MTDTPRPATTSGRALLDKTCECDPRYAKVRKHRRSWRDCRAHGLDDAILAIEAEARLLHHEIGLGLEVAAPTRKREQAKAKPERRGKRGGSAWHGQDSFGSPDKEGRWPADPGGGISRFFLVPRVDDILESQEQFMREQFLKESGGAEDEGLDA